MSSKSVRVERDGELALVVVHNPPVNTITAEVRAGLSEALDKIRPDTAIRAVLLLCEGGTFFSGADIGEFSGPPREVEYRVLFNAFEALAVPVVAAMHGTVMGGGLEIALACHYRVASPATRFALPEVTLGIIPGAGGTQRLPRLIGAEKALEFILSAKPISAPQAIEMGFVDATVEEICAQRSRIHAAAAGRGQRAAPQPRDGVDPATATSDMFERRRRRPESFIPTATPGWSPWTPCANPRSPILPKARIRNRPRQ